MTTEITISGNSGLDYSFEEIRQQIESATDDIAIVIDPANDDDPEPGEEVDPYEADEWLTLYEVLASHPRRVSVHIAGPVWSEGLLAMAADHVTISSKASFRLVSFYLKPPDPNVVYSTELMLQRLDPAFVDAYAEGSGRTPERVACLMVGELKLSPKQCVSLGFADELVEGSPSVAKNRFSRKVRTMKTLSSTGARAKFNRLVKARMKKGIPRAKAVAETARRNPKLHALSLIETNGGKDGRVLNDIRERGGLKAKKVRRVRATKAKRRR